MLAATQGRKYENVIMGSCLVCSFGTVKMLEELSLRVGISIVPIDHLASAVPSFGIAMCRLSRHVLVQRISRPVILDLSSET